MWHYEIPQSQPCNNDNNYDDDNREWYLNREHMFPKVAGYKRRSDIKEVDIAERRVYISCPGPGWINQRTDQMIRGHQLLIELGEQMILKWACSSTIIRSKLLTSQFSQNSIMASQPSSNSAVFESWAAWSPKNETHRTALSCKKNVHTSGMWVSPIPFIFFQYSPTFLSLDSHNATRAAWATMHQRHIGSKIGPVLFRYGWVLEVHVCWFRSRMHRFSQLRSLYCMCNTH